MRLLKHVGDWEYCAAASYDQRTLNSLVRRGLLRILKKGFGYTCDVVILTTEGEKHI